MSENDLRAARKTAARAYSARHGHRSSRLDEYPETTHKDYAGQELHPKQHAAIALLIQGMGYTAVAKAVGVERKVLWQWRQQATFQELLQAELQAVREAAQARLLALADKAFAALERTLDKADSDSARIAAVRIVLERLESSQPAEGAMSQQRPAQAAPFSDEQLDKIRDVLAMRRQLMRNAAAE